jgi:hypothetical protein
MGTRTTPWQDGDGRAAIAALKAVQFHSEREMAGVAKASGG